MLKLNLLGSPQIFWQNEPVLKLTSAKSQALLYYLALNRRAHSRLALSGLLWPDKSEDEARTNLRQTIRLARKLMPDLYDAQRETVQLKPELPVELDVISFEQAVSTYMKEGEQIETGLPTLLAAADLYQGPLLESFFVEEAGPFEDWMRLERERLHQMALDLFGQLAHYYADRKEIGAGLLYGNRLLGLDHLREESYQLLMRLHAWDGNYGAALQRYNGCVEMLSDEFGLEPSPETATLYKRIIHLRETSPPPLPVPNFPLVDRLTERADLHQLLHIPGKQMITLLGQGGIGKTRLALAIAEGERTRFLDGVYWIDLAKAENAEDVAYGIAEEVECRFSGSGSPEKQLRRYLRSKEMLLVLDNFEQLMRDKSAVRLVTQIMQASPDLKVLITSRIRLGLVQEQTYLLEHLPLPREQMAASAKIGEHDAVALFTHCARQIRPDWNDEEEKDAVHRICYLVEGLPLGLQMAASLIEYRSCRDIAAALEQNVSDLEIEALDLPERHQSLRAAFDYSFDLLDEGLQQLLVRLSVFHGRFSANAVAEILGGDVADLGRLVSRSLVRFEPPARYSLHTVVRQLTADRLQDADRDALQAPFNRYYLTFLAKQRERLISLDAKVASAAISADYENIRFAWLDAISSGDSANIHEAAQSLESYLVLRGMYHEGVRLFAPSDALDLTLNAILNIHLTLFFARLHRYDDVIQTVQASLESAPSQDWVQAKGRAYWAEALWRMGRYQEAYQLSQAALSIAAERGTSDELAHTHFNLGVISDYLNRHEMAMNHFETAREIWDSLPNPRKVANVLNSMAVVRHRMNEVDRAIDHFENALQLAEKIGDADVRLWILNNLGFIELDRENFDAAIEHLNLQIELAIKNGSRMNEGTGYLNLGEAYFGLKKYEQAKHAYNNALHIFQDSQDLIWIVNVHIHMGKLEGILGNLEEAIEHFELADDFIQENRFENEACELLIAKAEVERNHQNYEEQARLADLAMTLARQINNLSLIEQAQSLAVKK